MIISKVLNLMAWSVCRNYLKNRNNLLNFYLPESLLPKRKKVS